MGKIGDLTDTLKKRLSEDDCKLWNKLSDLNVELNKIEVNATFIYGCRLGAAIMQEMLADRKELICKADK
jgi:hypothetical protein